MPICFFLIFVLLLLFFASVLIFNNKDKIKNGFSVIINIVSNIKKGSGGNNVTLLWNRQKTSA